MYCMKTLSSSSRAVCTRSTGVGDTNQHFQPIDQSWTAKVLSCSQTHFRFRSLPGSQTKLLQATFTVTNSGLDSCWGRQHPWLRRRRYCRWVSRCEHHGMECCMAWRRSPSRRPCRCPAELWNSYGRGNRRWNCTCRGCCRRGCLLGICWGWGVRDCRCRACGQDVARDCDQDVTHDWEWCDCCGRRSRRSHILLLQ